MSAFTAYLGGLQQKGAIQAFDCILLVPHGDDLNGFFLIRWDARAGGRYSSPERTHHIIKAPICAEGVGVIRANTGAQVQERLTAWAAMLPPP